MARSGSNDRAERQARRQKKKARPSLPPASTPRATQGEVTPPPLPASEDASVIRERQHLAEPSEDAAEASLYDEFFAGGASSYLETVEGEGEEDEGGVDNPELSPAQYQRRRQLRRQVAMLVAALALFTLVTLFVRVAQ